MVCFTVYGLSAAYSVRPLAFVIVRLASGYFELGGADGVAERVCLCIQNLSTPGGEKHEPDCASSEFSAGDR